MNIMAVIGVTAAAVALAVGSVLILRQRAYLRLLKYHPQQNCVTFFTHSAVETIHLHCPIRGGFTIPEVTPDSTSALLELPVRDVGMIHDPVMELSVRDFCDRQVLERGVRGVRYLNLTRLLREGAREGEKVHLRGRRLIWNCAAKLHVCSERIQPDDRVLVVAPHPDDAEISAFGLYSDTDATVVTITAGDNSDRYTGRDGIGMQLARATIAQIRLWDSLTVPQLGGIPAERTLNLAYPDGRLNEMHAEPDRVFCSEGKDEPDFNRLRRMNRSPWLRSSGCCTWNSIVADLVHILAEFKPTVIATPHPWLDPHPDHLLTTMAVCEALRSSGDEDGRFFFYVVHNRRSELWPFGPAGSGVAMLPIFADDLVECEGFYSHVLSSQRQQAKFLALEAMHDLRDIGAPEPRPARVHLRQARKELAAALHGIGHPSTSYLRRAVRPDELFLTTPFTKGSELCGRMTERA
jgi:LmbE family N-acetylglucosaminyl deacetylase